VTNIVVIKGDITTAKVDAIVNAAELAQKYECKSIAFPAISFGVYGYPIEEAAKISVDVFSCDF
jgi:O-acetyl-ADP-ribose deacetylase (regulator of RNase III)